MNAFLLVKCILSLLALSLYVEVTHSSNCVIKNMCRPLRVGGIGGVGSLALPSTSSHRGAHFPEW